MSRGAGAATAAWLTLLGPAAHAQTVVTLEVGASVVEYDGFLVSGAATAAPTLRYDAANISMGVQGGWVLFESGNQILQGTAAAAWRTPPHGAWRAEFSGSLGASKYADTPGSGHALARTRVHYERGRRGGWAGVATGSTFGDSAATPVELGLGVWGVQPNLVLTGTVTLTRLNGRGYADVGAAARWSHGTLQLDGQAGLRDGDETFGRGVYGELSGLVSLTDRIRLALSGGRYPSDPVRGVVAARYFTLGLRVNLAGTRTPFVPTISTAMERAAGERRESAYGSRARLELTPLGERHRLRVYLSGARSVELMGDFTDWQPVGLTRIDTATWETRLSIASGVHRLNIRVDSGPWLVPRGTRLEETEFGGGVGVVVVP